MTRLHPPEGWLGASFAALAVGVAAGGMAVLACLVGGHFAHSVAYACGGLAGLSLAAWMLWLFYRWEIGVPEIWRIGRAVVQAFFFL